VTPQELAALRRELADQTAATLRGMFLGLDNYREADVRAFVEAALPILRGGQVTMAQLVAAYLTDVVATAYERPGLAPVVIPPEAVTDLRLPDPLLDVTDIPAAAARRVTVTVAPVTAARRAAFTAAVYRRPFATVYAGLAKHGDMTRAVAAGATRLDEIVEMDMQQTYAVAAKEGMDRLPEEVRPTSWYRMLQGEENCALCVLAASRLYFREELDPIHPGCDCTVEPNLPGRPAPFDLDQLYSAAHAAARELTGREDAGGRSVDYRKVMTNIQANHGEYPAPLLVRPLDHFTGPDEVPDSPPSATDGV
jgi:hypothetical protein